jgi:hypothetical protein
MDIGKLLVVTLPDEPQYGDGYNHPKCDAANGRIPGTKFEDEHRSLLL